MLSRVISGSDSREVEAAVFPDAAPEPETAWRERGPDRRQDRNQTGTDRSPGRGEGIVLCQHPEHSEESLEQMKRAAFEEGRRQGEREARAELEPVMARLTASLAGIVDLRPDLRRRAERDVIDLALLIAKRVLHREISVDPEALTAIARVAFERLARSESWRITIHPHFAEAIRAAIPPRRVSQMRVEPDPACALGTLIVHSSDGTLDASIDTQLDEISHGLTDRLVKSGGLR
jgi:flagellar assembly protein FliH